MIRRLFLVLMAGLAIASCGSSGPSCEERGGRTVSDPPVPVLIMVGKVPVVNQIPQSHCEMPR